MADSDAVVVVTGQIVCHESVRGYRYYGDAIWTQVVVDADDEAAPVVVFEAMAATASDT